MGILDMFRAPTPQQPQQVQQSGPQGQQPTGQQSPQQQQQQPNQFVENNPTVPNSGNSPTPLGPDGKPVSSPADNFASLWQTPTNPTPNPATAPLININQQQLAEQVKRMDFSKQIDPNLFQAVLGDDKQAAAQALATIVNNVGQQAVAQGLIGNSLITEGAVKEYGKTIRSEIPTLIKQQTTHESLRQLNPALQNPAFAPMVGAVRDQMQLKYPNATAAELTQQVSDYFDMFAQAANAPKTALEQQKQQQADKSQDWGDFLGIPTSLANM